MQEIGDISTKDSNADDELEATLDQASKNLQRPNTFDLSLEPTIKANDETFQHFSGLPSENSAYSVSSAKVSSLASKQLAAGFLQIIEPPVAKARCQLKDLISKQNKIYIDLSAEKYKLDNGEITQLQEMMTNVKVYREKLLKIKKQMQNIYQRSKSLKKRVQNIEASKQKELQRKLQKQQQEEALIGK